MGSLAVIAVSVAVSITAASPSSAAPSANDTSANDSAAVAYQSNATHDGRQIDPDFAGTSQSILWSKDLGGTVAYPLIVGDTIYVDVANNSGAGFPYGTKVSAYDRRTGALLWGPVSIGGVYSFGAIAYDRGRIFALNHDGLLFALDAATGHEVWSEQLPRQYSFTSAPTAINGVVYVGGSGSGGTLYAVDEATSALLWTAAVANGDSSSPAVDSSGVYVSYACEQAYSFTTAGQLRWRHSTSCAGGGGRTPVLHDGRVYIRDDAGFAPAVLNESEGTQVGAFTSTPAPAFDDSTMVTLAGGTLRGSDVSTAAIKWSHATTPGFYVTAPLIVNGYVVEGDNQGNVHLFNADSGEDVWQANAGAPIGAPDEHDAVGLTGLAEAQGVLAVPAGTRLTVFGQPGVWFGSAPANGAVVGRNVSISFGTNLPNAIFMCHLDDVPAPCSSPFTRSGLNSGSHTFEVVATNGSGSESNQTTFITDAAPPLANVQSISQFSQNWTTTASWSARDVGAGVADYDVRYRTASPQSGFGAYQQPASLQGTHATSVTLRPAPGSTVCVSVRARDRVGNVSGWSEEKCQAVLLDDRALKAAGSWYRPSGATGFAAGTVSATSARGASLSLSGAHVRRIEVVAMTCSTCGRVAVSFPGMKTATLNLHSTKTVKQTFFVLGPMSGATGRLTLTALDAGKAVWIDAIGIWQQ